MLLFFEKEKLFESLDLLALGLVLADDTVLEFLVLGSISFDVSSSLGDVVLKISSLSFTFSELSSCALDFITHILHSLSLLVESKARGFEMINFTANTSLRIDKHNVAAIHYLNVASSQRNNSHEKHQGLRKKI